jgi:hypothetical protein
MKKALLIQYLVWYFYDVPMEVIVGWKNYLIFTFNYFSVDILIQTFFSHWHKYSLKYGKTISPSWYFEVFVFNMMSRIIGIILRIFLIMIGIISGLFVFFFGIAFLVFWLLLPFVLFFSFLYGLRIMALI